MRKYAEEICWLLALIALFFMNTSNGSTSLCLFSLVGIDSCPGCGLGHAIHYTLRFDFAKAFAENKMGIPVTLLLIYRIIKPFIHKKNPTQNGYQTTAGFTAGSTD